MAPACDLENLKHWKMVGMVPDVRKKIERAAVRYPWLLSCLVTRRHVFLIDQTGAIKGSRT